MNLKELKQLVKQGESNRLEFKKTTGQRTAAIKTVCAMLNGIGGFVIFGVADKGEIAGQQVSTKTIEDISNEIRNIEPPAFPDIETISLKSGKSVIIIHVTGSRGLYAYSGRSYIRSGPTTIQMPRSEYNNRLMEKLHATSRWENQPVAEGVTVSDLDEEEIQIAVNNSVRLGRLEPVKKRNVESILRGFGLIHEGNLLNAAVALFGKSERLKVLYPQCRIQMARFRGKDRLGDFIDNRHYWGNAFVLLRRAETFLIDYVPIAGRVTPGKMIREDRPKYPPLATREALANALCHRDYSISGGSVNLAMYDDYLEIISPGELHFGLDIEKLLKPHESKLWNPIVAEAFYRTGIIEKWGTGTLKILDWCREGFCPQPQWKEQAGSLYVTFLPAEDFKELTVSQAELQPESQLKSRLKSQLKSKNFPLRDKVCILLSVGEISKSEIAAELEQKQVSGQLHKVIRMLISEDIIEYTIPEKPQSRLQKYRLTAKGKAWLDSDKGK